MVLGSSPVFTDPSLHAQVRIKVGTFTGPILQIKELRHRAGLCLVKQSPLFFCLFWIGEVGVR